jgi:hypothetical protein
MRDLTFAFTISLATLLAAALVPLVIYAATSAKGAFDPVCFVRTSRSRLIYGFIAMAIVAGLLTCVDAAGAALALVGFAPGGSEVALGFTIGGLLVAAIRGDKVESVSGDSK